MAPTREPSRPESEVTQRAINPVDDSTVNPGSPNLASKFSYATLSKPNLPLVHHATVSLDCLIQGRRTPPQVRRWIKSRWPDLVLKFGELFSKPASYQTTGWSCSARPCRVYLIRNLIVADPISGSPWLTHLQIADPSSGSRSSAQSCQRPPVASFYSKGRINNQFHATGLAPQSRLVGPQERHVEPSSEQ